RPSSPANLPDSDTTALLGTSAKSTFRGCPGRGRSSSLNLTSTAAGPFMRDTAAPMPAVGSTAVGAECCTFAGFRWSSPGLAPDGSPEPQALRQVAATAAQS